MTDSSNTAIIKKKKKPKRTLCRCCPINIRRKKINRVYSAEDEPRRKQRPVITVRKKGVGGGDEGDGKWQGGFKFDG